MLVSKYKILSRWLNYPIVAICMGYILGIGIKTFVNIQESNILITVPIIILIALFIRSKGLCILGVFFLLGFIRFNSYFNYDTDHVMQFVGKEGEYNCTVMSEPHETKFAKTMSMECRSDRNLKGWILLETKKYTEIKRGDIIEVKCSFFIPENNNDFDYKEYLRTKSIFVICKDNYAQIITNTSNPILLMREEVRQRIKLNVHEPHSSLMLGILIGDIEEMPDDFSFALSNTSTSHIVAVSGYNVNIILITILTLSGKIHRKVLLMMSLILVTIFLTIVGFDNIPAFRATLIAYSFIFSKMIGRRGSFVGSLFLSASILGFINPLIFKDISFLLSFSSTAGLYFLVPKLKQLLTFVPNVIKEDFTTTLAATISTLPIILNFFGKLSVLGLFVNLIVLPFVPISMFVSFVYIVALSIAPSVSQYLGFFAFYVIDLIINIIYFFGSFQGSLEVNNPEIVIIPTIIFIIVLLNLNDDKDTKY